jgi:hypothetical protein
MPDGVDWQGWPVLEVLQAESGLSISKLRSRLASVACYRCTDKSVRYEPAAARAAIAGEEPDDDDDDPAAGIDADSFTTNAGVYGVFAMLIREQMRMNAETRRERQETVKVMQGPLELGTKLLEKAAETQAKRLEHLEGLWDRMVAATEQMLTFQHQRERERQKQDDSAAMRRQALGLLKEHGPMMMDKWALTREAQLALEFLGSLNPKIVDTVKDVGILTPEQVEMLSRLQASMAKRQPPQPKPEAEPANHAS